ncbi:MAG: hypothetical protein AAGF79_17200, partial [Pseudomonadota bacterium]
GLRADRTMQLGLSRYHSSTAEHEAALRKAGLTDIVWHPLKLPPQYEDLRPVLEWYLDNPSCIVLSARKPEV